jgi:competence protein ComGC
VKSTLLRPAVYPHRSSLLVWMLICLIVAIVLVLLIIQPALAQKKFSAAEAKDHVGKTATVMAASSRH